MTDQARVLLVAAPDASIRVLEDRLQDPDLLIVPCPTATAALDQLALGMPDVAIVDASVPGAQVFRLYSRLRASAAGFAVPLLFTNHTGAELSSETATAPDYYLGPAVDITDVEQLLFTFLPESLVEIEEPFLPEPTVELPTSRRPSIDSLLDAVRPRDLALPLMYAALLAAAELLAATVSGVAGLALHAGAVVASFLQGTMRPAGSDHAFFSTYWLVPLLRISILAQPFVGVSMVWWWALTAVPMIVAVIVAVRLAGLRRDDAGFRATPRDLLLSALMLPVGLGIGLLGYVLLDPLPIVRETSLGYPLLPLLVIAVNPALVEEMTYRAVLLPAAMAALGPVAAVAYVGLVSGIAGASVPGSGPTLLGFPFLLVVGLLFSIVTRRTGSIAAATAAHIGLALSLFLIGPALIPGSLARGATDGGAAGRLPVPVVSPVPLRSPEPAVGVPQAGAPSQTGSPSPAARSGPIATVVVVVPLPALSPLPAPSPVGPAPSAASPQASGAPSGAAPAGQSLVVNGTGGAGARLRSQPSSAAPTLAVVPDNTAVVAIGPERAGDGVTWRQVRTPSGQEGWMASQFLTSGRDSVPATPRP